MHAKSLLCWVALGSLFMPGEVQAAAPDAPLFFSEYVEGSENNKALEIYNAGDTSVSLDGCVIKIYANGVDVATSEIELNGTLDGREVFVVASRLASAAVADNADLLSGSLSFNGDDAVALLCTVPGEDPDSDPSQRFFDTIGRVREQKVWGSGEVTTKDHTLRRIVSVTRGDRDPRDAFDPAQEWEGFAIDTFDDLGAPPSQSSPVNPSPVLGGFALFGLAAGFWAMRRR